MSNFELTIRDIPHYTYSDYKLWEGDWELIGGVPWALRPAPNWRHQKMGGNFVFGFKTTLKQSNNLCGCEILYECDWIVNETTVVRPDMMIVCDPIEGDYPTKPPVLILEILSPSSVLKDRNTKFGLYQACGVKYYLIGNADTKEIEYFVLNGTLYQQVYKLDEYMLTPQCTVKVDFAGMMG